MHSIAWWPTIICVSIATVTDVRSRRIPNWLAVPFLIAGVVVSTMAYGWSGLAHSVGGVMLAALLLGLFYLAGGMGMGDVKLCAGMGAWIWPPTVKFCTRFHGSDRRNNGIRVGYFKGILKGIAERYKRSDFRAANARIPPAPGTRADKSRRSQDPVRAGDRDRNDSFLFRRFMKNKNNGEI